MPKNKQTPNAKQMPWAPDQEPPVDNVDSLWGPTRLPPREPEQEFDFSGEPPWEDYGGEDEA